MASIQFILGRDETIIPDVKLFRSKDGSSGQAKFFFEKAQSLIDMAAGDEILGMYLIDEEGEITTRSVNAKFINGQPAGLEAVCKLNSPADWDRFMRFMERYAEQNGLGFAKS